MEKGNSLIRTISYYGAIAVVTVFVVLLVAGTMFISVEKLDIYFNQKQENVDERFTVEYRSIDIDVYHDNELNVTCYKITNTGLSCILDAEIGRR